MLGEHCESFQPHKHAAHHPLQHYIILSSYLFDMCMKGDRHVQQDFALLHAADKVLNSVFELVGGLVDLLWVALSRLGQLLSRLQQLVGIGVCILHSGTEAQGLDHEGNAKEAQCILKEDPSKTDCRDGG